MLTDEMLVLGGDENLRALVRNQLGENHKSRTLVVIDYVRHGPILLGEETVKILVRFEGPTTSPLSHRRAYSELFHSVIDVGESEDFPWPWQMEGLNSGRLSSKERLSRVVSVAGNKLSFQALENYSLRRLIYSIRSSVDFYGTGWSSGFVQKSLIALREWLLSPVFHLRVFSILRSWFAVRSHIDLTIEDKAIIFKRYRTALVIENDRSKVTEKLFDGLACGCHVLYFGHPKPSLPKELSPFVTVFDSAASLVSFLDQDFLLLELPTPDDKAISYLVRYEELSHQRLFQSIKRVVSNTSKS